MKIVIPKDIDKDVIKKRKQQKLMTWFYLINGIICLNSDDMLLISLGWITIIAGAILLSFYYVIPISVRIYHMIYMKRGWKKYYKGKIKEVKKRGILVETFEKGTSFIFCKREQYKKELGAVPVINMFGKITNVFVVYEDFDGSIKYYNYPQN